MGCCSSKSSRNWGCADVPNSIAGKVVLVTGGNSGIGFQICSWLFDAGANVIMVGRSTQRVETAVQDIREKSASGRHGKITGMIADLSDSKSIQSCCSSIASNFEHIDIVRSRAPRS